MPDISLHLNECIQNKDCDTIKKLISDNSNDTKYILSYLKKHDSNDMFEKIDNWLYESNEECDLNKNEDDDENSSARNKRQKFDESNKICGKHEVELKNENSDISGSELVDKENCEEANDSALFNCISAMGFKNEARNYNNGDDVMNEDEIVGTRNLVDQTEKCRKNVDAIHCEKNNMAENLSLEPINSVNNEVMVNSEKTLQNKSTTNLNEISKVKDEIKDSLKNTNVYNSNKIENIEMVTDFSVKINLNMHDSNKDLINLQNKSKRKIYLSEEVNPERIAVNEKTNNISKSNIDNEGEIYTDLSHENDKFAENTDNKEEIYFKKSNEEIKEQLTRFLTQDTMKNRLITAFYTAMCSNTTYFNYPAIAKISQDLVNIIIDTNKHKEGEFIRSKISNLKNSMNPDLCDSVVRSILKPEDYLKLTNDEMKSKNLKLKEQKILHNTLMDSQFKQIEAETDMFRCSKCKNRKTTYSQLQTRSADEPMTTFVTCVVCKHRWKF